MSDAAMPAGAPPAYTFVGPTGPDADYYPGLAAADLTAADFAALPAWQQVQVAGSAHWRRAAPALPAEADAPLDPAVLAAALEHLRATPPAGSGGAPPDRPAPPSPHADAGVQEPPTDGVKEL